MFSINKTIKIVLLNAFFFPEEKFTEIAAYIIPLVWGDSRHFRSTRHARLKTQTDQSGLTKKKLSPS